MTNDYYALLGYISQLPEDQKNTVNYYVSQLEEAIAQDEGNFLVALGLIGAKYGEK